MAITARMTELLTLDEYLVLSYEPDLEFVDGVLEEKHMGDWDHCFLQAMVSHWFLQRRAEGKINVLTGYRTRTS